MQNNSGYNFSFMSEAKLPPIYMNVRQIEFVVTQILQSFIEQSTGKKELVILAAKNNEMVEISLTLNGKGKSAKNRGAEVFDLISNPEKGYSFALASSIIHSHNGNVILETSEEGIKSILLNMPGNEI